MRSEVPSGWSSSVVADCCDILDSKRVPLNSEQRQGIEGSIPYWGANGIVDHINDYIFDEPLLLMAEDGGYFDQAHTRPICHLVDGKSWVNNHAHVMRVRSGILREYVYYWFVHRDITRYINSGTRSKLNQADLRTLTLHLPPLPEQKKIAAILSSVDEAIQTTQAVIEQTRRVKEGLLQDLLTKGIGHTRFKQTEIGEIPEAWEVRRVGDFLTLQRGFDITKAEVKDGPYPVISSSGVSYFHAEWKVQPPGVVTGRKGKLGDVYFVERPFWPHDTSLWVKNFRGNDPRFVRWFLEGLHLEQLDAATSVPTLNRNNVHRLKAGFPPLEEQRRIATLLSETEAVVAEMEVLLTAYSQLKTGLLQDLLTGKVRVSA